MRKYIAKKRMRIHTVFHYDMSIITVMVRSAVTGLIFCNVIDVICNLQMLLFVIHAFPLTECLQDQNPMLHLVATATHRPHVFSRPSLGTGKKYNSGQLRV